MIPLQTTTPPNAGKQNLRANLIHTHNTLNNTVPTSFTPLTQHLILVQHNLYHCTHIHIHHQVRWVPRHHNVQHHRSTLRHLPPNFLSFLLNPTPNPPHTRLTHPICLSMLRRSPPWTTLHTWPRHQVGPSISTTKIRINYWAQSTIVTTKFLKNINIINNWTTYR